MLGAFRVGGRRALAWRRGMSSVAEGPLPGEQFAERSRRAQLLFGVRKGDEKPQDGMEVWGVQQTRRRVRQVRKVVPEDAAPRTELTKGLSDSLLTLMLPFKSDPKLRDVYLNASGHLRIGKLLEDVDSFAGQVAYIHCDDPNPAAPPLTIVTASLDRFDLLAPIPVDADLQLRGCVGYVGSSSMSIVVTLSQIPLGLTASEAASIVLNEDPAVRSSSKDAAEVLSKAAEVGGASDPILVRADLTFVARDHENNAVHVPRLEPRTEYEKSLYTTLRLADLTRRASRSSSLDKLPPTPHELGLIHSVFMDSRRPGEAERGRKRSLPSGMVYCSDTTLDSTVVTFPTDRNIHGKVFGGWLLRNAFELAWVTALRFGGQTPTFVAMSDIAFLRPVEIGHVLTFRATVAFAEGGHHRTASVRVETTSMDPLDPTTMGPTTNTFHFVFEFPDKARTVPQAVPETYEDAMHWVAAHRRRQAGLQVRASWQMRGATNRV
jgi:acyl-coenzyme A thioesterase 9